MSVQVLTNGGQTGMTASIYITGLSSTDVLTVSGPVASRNLNAKWNEDTNRFEITNIKDKGLYTIEATNGILVRTKEVLVDGAFDYSIEIDYKLWLYNAGDECISTTGGWVTKGLPIHSGLEYPSAPTLTKNASNMVISRTNASSLCGIVLPANKIDFTGYKTINAVVTVPTIASNHNCLFFGYYIQDKLSTYCEDGTRWFTFSNSHSGVTNKTVSANISNCSGLFIPYLSLYSSGAMTVYKIWLE